MIQLNLNLLNKYFIQNIEHNVLVNIFNENELVLDKETIDKTLKYLKTIIYQEKSYSGLYTIDSKEAFSLYMIEHIYHDLKVIKHKFTNDNEFFMFIYINFSLFLTQFSQNALEILKYMPSLFFNNLDNIYIQKIFSFIDSNDPRGLIFFISSKYHLPFDRLIAEGTINYEYTEPAINKKWQKKYRVKNQPITFWFYDSIVGKSLFLVLYTPRCRYKLQKGGCSGCNLPTVSSQSDILNTNDILLQVQTTFDNALSFNEKESIQELMLSNNGSILDSKTMDIEALKYTLEKALDTFPNLKKIILETRIDHYTNIEQLDVLQKILKKSFSNIKLEIAIGFEIFNDSLRNGYYKKGLDKAILEEKLHILSNLDISLKVYMMYKAVPDKLMSIDEAIEDLNNASIYFNDLAKKNNVKINLHINPTYLAEGTPLYEEYKNKNYTPPSNKDILQMYNSLIIKENISYYISMNDEGLAEKNQRDLDYNEYINLKEKLHKFNMDNYIS